MGEEADQQPGEGLYLGMRRALTENLYYPLINTPLPEVPWTVRPPVPAVLAQAGQAGAGGWTLIY